MAAQSPHNQQNMTEKDDKTVLNKCESVVDINDVDNCIKDLMECIKGDSDNNTVLNQDKSVKKTMDIFEEKRDLNPFVDLQNEVVCLDDEDPIKICEDLQIIVNLQNDPLRDETLARNEEKNDHSSIEEKKREEIFEKMTIENIEEHISQKETAVETKKKQRCSSFLKEENFEKMIVEDYIIPKINISQEETDEEERKKQGFSSISEEENIEKMIIEDYIIPKINISQEEIDGEQKKKQGFSSTPEEENVEKMTIEDFIIPKINISQEETDAKIHISQEEMDAEEKKKQRCSSISEEEIGEKMIIEDKEKHISHEINEEEKKKQDCSSILEEEIVEKITIEDKEEQCITPKIRISQEINAEEKKKQDFSSISEEEIVGKLTIEDKEEQCITPKIRISQEINAEEKKKQDCSSILEEENVEKMTIEDNEELCITPKIRISQEETLAETKKKQLCSSISKEEIVTKMTVEVNEDLCNIPKIHSQEETDAKTVTKKKNDSSSSLEEEITKKITIKDLEDLCIIPDKKPSISQEKTDAETATKKKNDSSSILEEEIAKKTTREDNEEKSDSETVAEQNIVCTEPEFASNEKKKEEIMASVNKSSTEPTDNLQIKVAKKLRATIETCHQCNILKKCFYRVEHQEETYLCSETCVISFRALNKPSDIYKPNSGCQNRNTFTRKCAQCNTNIKTEDESVLIWETLEFCNEDCLCRYQTKIGSNCAFCQKTVLKNNLGKYCVRFGFDLRQFCRSLCLEEFKKRMKACTNCQKDISDSDTCFLAPTNDKQFREFCSSICAEKYNLSGDSAALPKFLINCAVCDIKKQVQVVFERKSDKETTKTYFCSAPCFVAFKFVNKITPLRCEMCKIYFETNNSVEFSLFYEQTVKHFCCKSCQNTYIILNRRIVSCTWCKVKKYNFDMIKKSFKTGQSFIMCSLNCLSLFQVSLKATSGKKVKCDYCNKVTISNCSLTMSDATLRNFCAEQCLVLFQKNKRCISSQKKKNDAAKLPVITNVQSLQNLPQIIHHFIVKDSPLKPIKNACTSCEPIVHTKGTNCRPSQSTKSTQTDSTKQIVGFIPIPVPIYVPAPLPMFSTPLPIPIPFPLPVPVPVFVPTTHKTSAGILKEMKKIKEKIPADPYEAEMVLMAGIVAGDEKSDNSDSESSCSCTEYTTDKVSCTVEEMDNNISFGDDKMAADLNESVFDFENSLIANTITLKSHNESLTAEQEAKNESQAKGKKKVVRTCRKRAKVRDKNKNKNPAKKERLKSSEMDPPSEHPIHSSENPIKSDANMSLKYTFGVNAWKLWISKTNSELEKTEKSSFCHELKRDILQLTSEELNYSLSLFVQKVRKPNGEEYAPDTIFYLCLGIQQYLYENDRIDNIFTDIFYEKFTDSLDEITKNFSLLYDDSQYIVTRVEEEHLWETKQLGVHSPFVLLNTLLYFNTKFFNLTTVEEHLQLTFSHIMRHWTDKKDIGCDSKNVYLKFYTPRNILKSNRNKKRVYEQSKNEENPFRCPVRIFEFYLTKTPESVKTSRDLFYLTPERYCLPESPKWYSPTGLDHKVLGKMLHRIKLVKEINVAMLAMA